MLGLAIALLFLIRMRTELSLLINNYLVAFAGLVLIVDSAIRIMKEYKILTPEWWQTTAILCIFSVIFIYHFDESDLRIFFLNKSKDEKIKILKSELKNNSSNSEEVIETNVDLDFSKMFEEYHSKK
jgi:hypothetical protein